MFFKAYKYRSIVQKSSGTIIQCERFKNKNMICGLKSKKNG